MKKVRFLIFVFLLVLSFAACSNTAEISESAMEIPTTVPMTLSETTPVSQEHTTIVEDTTPPATTSAESTTQTVDFVSTTAPTAEPTAEPATEPATESITESTTGQATTQSATGVPTTQEATTQETTTQETTVAATAGATETTAIPTTAQPTTVSLSTQMQNYCIVRIECHTIYDNLGKLKDSKKSFLPSNGVILDNVQVALSGGESVFDVIKKACAENICTDRCNYCQSGGVQIEYTYTPAFNNYYIEGIHQIYEKDCGTQSGWMYSVNGQFPDVGTSAYMVSSGDVIVFSFTCNMGEDIGNSY